MSNKITINELRKIIKQIINETPFDDIDFSFMDREEEEKNALKTRASEELYNKMAKDVDILKQIYHSTLDSENKVKARANFRNSQMMNRVERYMDELYKNTEYKKMINDQQLFKVCEMTFDKFFDDAYEAALKRHNRP